MSTKALTGLKAEWFTPSDQRPALQDPDEPESEENPLVEVEDPTRYKIKALDGLGFMEVAAHGEVLIDGTFMPNHQGRILLLNGGLKGWENLDDPEAGGPLKFVRTNFKYVPAPHLSEVANEIFEASALGADERKN